MSSHPGKVQRHHRLILSFLFIVNSIPLYIVSPKKKSISYVTIFNLYKYRTFIFEI
jgi:hypothetical protein